jgi:HAD superfamily hydrolase (TIGR01490 family)
MIAAVFDVDGTICANKMGPGIIKYSASHGRSFGRFSYFLALLPKFILKKLGLLSSLQFQEANSNAFASFLRGKDIQQGADLLEWVAREYQLPSKRPSVMQRLEAHREKGHLLMIVSGAFRPVVYSIAQELGVNDFIATQLEAREGIYTGHIIPPHISGTGKVTKMLEYVSIKGMDVDWKSSYVYSDSDVDKPLFELVGHPVAVHPDKDLKAIAKKENWEIVEGTN